MSKELQFDFSDNYLTEEVDLGEFYGHPFKVTVVELSNEVYVKFQQEFIGTFHVPENKRDLKAQLANKVIDPAKRNDRLALAAVRSWTLKDRNGNDVPVCEAAWKALPRRLTEKIEEAIERLNPTIEDDFQTGDDSES